MIWSALWVVYIVWGSTYLAIRVANGAGAHPWIVGCALIMGYIAADLVSGVVHWIFDTFGTVDTPLVGDGWPVIAPSPIATIAISRRRLAT